MPADAIALPIAIASGVIPGDLTAPAMRAALVLIGRADASGNFDILKPDLERLTDLRLDNADRFLNRLRDSQFETADGMAPAFAEIVYIAGIKGRLAGVIRGQLSAALIDSISSPVHAGRTVTLAFDELRRLRTTPGILLLLWLSTRRGDDELRIRMTDRDALQVFGPYVARAAITRTTKRDGEHQWTGLSRIFSELVEPGIRDLWGAIPGYDIDAVPMSRTGLGRGRAWSHIEVSMVRLVRRMSVKQLAARQREIEDYERRKHINEDPAKMRPTGSVEPQEPGASVPDNEGAQ